MVGSGACIPGDFPVGQEVDCPEPMAPGQNVVRKEGTAKREASGARALGSSYLGKPGWGVRKVGSAQIQTGSS